MDLVNIQNKMTQTKQEWLNGLANFIVEANKKTWAAEGSEVEPRFKKSKRHNYKNELWELDDDYSGYFTAPGFTRVLYKGIPVWSMAYFGKGMTEGYEHLSKPTFSFLKEALMEVTSELPFRGPHQYPYQYNRNGLNYRFSLLRESDITDFLAEEEIRDIYNIRIFQQTVGGGIIRHRDDNKKLIFPWEL